MRRYDIIIAIDPDIKKSGVCVLSPSTRKFTLENLTFPETIEFLRSMKTKYEGVRMIVIVEAGWLNEKSCFHEAQGKRAEKVAKDVGRNQQTGILILEMCEHNRIPCEGVRPLTKHWKGRGGKITHEEIAYFTGATGKTNQETRDALLLAWDFSNLPVRIKTY